MKPARSMALSGVLAALGVTVMMLGGIFPLATYCAPVFVSLLLIPVKERCGTKLAWVWYLAVAILAVLLCPDKEAAGVFVAIGFYPIVKPRFDALRPKWLGAVLKGLLFTAVITAVYTVLILLLGMGELWEEFSTAGLVLGIATVILGLVTFYITDVLIGRLTRLWKIKFKIRK